MDIQTNLMNMDRPAMENYFINIDEKPFRASQILKWIYHQGITEFNKMTNLSLNLRQDLNKSAIISMLDLVTEQISEDGTCKWLFRIDNYNCIETVFIPENDRGTLCISSQVGCPLDCSFCSTAKQGFNRNLTVSEIIGQVWMANKLLGHFETGKRYITNIVLMGMGEPLLNLDNVVMAMNLMTDDLAFGMSRKRITLSTSGIIPGINRLAEISNVSLAVSLHATNNELRNQLVPINRKYPIEDLLVAVKKFTGKLSDTAVTIEYVMLDGVNDSVIDAAKLSELLHDIPVKVNLIPFNPFPGTNYRCPSAEVINQFREILIRAGIITITRKTRGVDIDAACGQLVGRVNPLAKRHQHKYMGNIL